MDKMRELKLIEMLGRITELLEEIRDNQKGKSRLKKENPLESIDLDEPPEWNAANLKWQ